eukprot:COSAG06_NODE_12226_length_1407_cov_3.003058_2_plen_110_part_00
MKSDVKVAVTNSVQRAIGRLDRNDGENHRYAMAALRTVHQAITDFDPFKTRRASQLTTLEATTEFVSERLDKGVGAHRHVIRHSSKHRPVYSWSDAEGAGEHYEQGWLQ